MKEGAKKMYVGSPKSKEAMRLWRAGGYTASHPDYDAFEALFLAGKITTTEPKAESEAFGKPEPAKDRAILEKEAEAVGLIRDFKKLPPEVQESLSVLDFGDLKALSDKGDQSAKVALDHWNYPALRATWGSVGAYYAYLERKEKKANGRA
jgi:hypothetical protein